MKRYNGHCRMSSRKNSRKNKKEPRTGGFKTRPYVADKSRSREKTSKHGFFARVGSTGYKKKNKKGLKTIEA